MVSDNHNGHKVEKKCPWGLECDKCRLSIEMMRVESGLQQKFNQCAFVAMTNMLSEINLKTQAPQQKINFSNLFRG